MLYLKNYFEGPQFVIMKSTTRKYSHTNTGSTCSVYCFDVKTSFSIFVFELRKTHHIHFKNMSQLLHLIIYYHYRKKCFSKAAFDSKTEEYVL